MENPLRKNEMNIAQEISAAAEKVSWDWTSMTQSHPNIIAAAAIRKLAEQLKDASITSDIVFEIANELEKM